MFEIAAQFLEAARPFVEAFTVPLQLTIIYLLWRVERRVFKLEIDMRHFRGVHSGGQQ